MPAFSGCEEMFPFLKGTQNSNPISHGTLPLSQLGWEQMGREMVKRVMVKRGLFGDGDGSRVLGCSYFYPS